MQARWQGKTFIIDTRATISTSKEAVPTGDQTSAGMADGNLVPMKLGSYDGSRVLIGPENLMGLKDLAKAEKVRWLKEIDNEQQVERILSETEITDKVRLEEILREGTYSGFKNECGFIEMEPYQIRGRAPGKVKQYPVNPAGAKEIQITIDELVRQGVLVVEPEPPCLTPYKQYPSKMGDGGWYTTSKS